MLNFGQMRERYENITGESIAAASLASRIDKAQIEIAKLFGKRVAYWYPPKVTTLSEGVDKEDTMLEIVSWDDMPEAPATIYLGEGKEVEIVTYNEISGGVLDHVERGVEDTEPKSWPEGTPVSLKHEAGKEYELPVDYLLVNEIRDADNMPEFSYYISEEMNIAFRKNGFKKLIYTPVPQPINYNENGATPEVHPVFHEDIITFCVAMHWEDIAEGIQGEEQKAINLKQQFYRHIEESARTLKWNVNQQYSIAFRLWS